MSHQTTWDVSAFQPLVQFLVGEASTYERALVDLFDGDSHVFIVNRPLAAGSRWLGIYGVEGSADLSLAGLEVARVAAEAEPIVTAEPIVGTLLYEPVLLTLRRMAHEAVSARP